MIKSPLRYPGGKSRAVDKIRALVPDFQEFREPFLGGGSVFLHLKQLFPNKNFWVNDLYPELFKFWEMCQKAPKAVIEQVQIWKNKYPVGKDLYKFLNENLPTFDDLGIASAFFIFNRVTFSGTTEAGGYSEQAFAGRFTQSSIDRLQPFASLLADTQITNLDYNELLQKEGEEVFIFLDPPYFSATKSALYGKRGTLHKHFDHLKFAENLKKCPHKWLITYDDSEYIRQLFDFAHITSWNLTYGMRNVGKNSDQIGKELFISNYQPIEKMQPVLLFA